MLAHPAFHSYLCGSGIELIERLNHDFFDHKAAGKKARARKPTPRGRMAVTQ